MANKSLFASLKSHLTRADILNVGGFSDAVFGVVAAFLAEDAGRFVAEVEAMEA